MNEYHTLRAAHRTNYENKKMCCLYSMTYGRSTIAYQIVANNVTFTVFDLISGHMLVKTIARAHRDLCVLAVLLCCIMQSIFDAN